MNETKMTTERLAEIRERLEKATPGPWVVTFSSAGEARVGPEQRAIALLRHAWESMPDATLIANAPADLADLLAEHDRLTAQLAELQRKNSYYMSAVEVCEDFKKLHPLLDGFDGKPYYPENVAEFIKHTKAQLAEAQAEATGYRDALVRVKAIGEFPTIAQGAIINEALSTPPSHYAKRVELMGKVVEAAMKWRGVQVLTSGRLAPHEYPLIDALEKYEECESEREGGGR